MAATKPYTAFSGKLETKYGGDFLAPRLEVSLEDIALVKEASQKLERGRYHRLREAKLLRALARRLAAYRKAAVGGGVPEGRADP